MAKDNRKKEEIKGVSIEKMSSTGKGLFRHDNRVVFVDKAVPGDICDIRITRNKKNYSEAIITEIRKPSKIRIDPVCEHFGLCGGCKWQNIRYEDQLSYKEDQVRDALERLALTRGFKIDPIIPCSNSLGFRNKLEYTFSERRWFTTEELNRNIELDPRGVGFHARGQFDKIVDIDKCHLQVEPSNAIRNSIKEWGREKNISFFAIKKNSGFLRNLIIRTSSTGEVMVICQFGKNDEKNISELMELLTGKFPEISSLNYVVNTKKNEKFDDLEVITYKGNPFIHETMELPGDEGTLKFRISPKSFFQTNSRQAELLYQKVYELANLKGNELVYDLYTGTGTIANYLAGKAKNVIGIEYIEQAVKDAYVNAEINEIDNVEFFHGDMARVLNEDFFTHHGTPDLLIADPPRAGIHPDVIDAILKSKTPKIIYVSCNPSTQARDLQLLLTKYEIRFVQPLDMFPQTAHVENIVVLDVR